MPADISAITYFAPIATFLIIFVVSFAILAKSKLLGENKMLNLFISFLIASIFISVGGAVTYVRTTVPLMAVLIISLVLVLMLTGIIGKPMEKINKRLGILFVIIAGLVFLISALLLFSHLFIGYLPGPNFGSGINESSFALLDWLYSPRIAGATLLIIISAIVTWVLVKTK